MRYEKGGFIVVPTVTRGWPPAQQVLYMWLCYYQNNEGVAWPSVTRLAADTGMTVSSIAGWMKRLCDSGYIRKTARFTDEGRQTSNLYELFITPENDPQEFEGGEGAEIHGGHPPESRGLELNSNKLNSEGTQKTAEAVKNIEPRTREEANKRALGQISSLSEDRKTTSPSSARPPSSTPRKTTPEDDSMASLLFKLMRENNPKCKQPNFLRWADDISLMRRMDKRSTREIEGMIRWSQQDSFWRQNILSPIKLRKHWDRMYMRMKDEYETHQGNKVQDFSFNPEDLLT